MSDLEVLVREGDIDSVRAWLAEANPLEIADELPRLEAPERALAFRLLEKGRALDVFEAIEPADQQELLEGLRHQQVLQLVEGMDPDDRARLLDEMPATVAHRVLSGLSGEERRLTSLLLGYPRESAGRMMSPEYIDLRPDMTVDQALEKVRRFGARSETIYMLPVTDGRRRVVGVVSLRDLVLAEPTSRIGDLMETEIHSANALDDQEEVARLIEEADLLAVPVLDREGLLVGIITADDAMSVLDVEGAEDFARIGAAEPLGRHYLSVSIPRLARSRAVWLLVLIVAATLTVSVLRAFEGTIDQVVTLALFIPLLIGTGGNAGAQTATTIVRAMAVDEVRFSDMGRVVLRELRVGVLLGTILGSLALAPVRIFAGPQIAVVVSVTLVAICSAACFAGSILPMVAKRAGIDPAVVSAPFITTIVDASGLLIYFVIARLVLGI